MTLPQTQLFIALGFILLPTPAPTDSEWTLNRLELNKDFEIDLNMLDLNGLPRDGPKTNMYSVLLFPFLLKESKNATNGEHRPFSPQSIFS